MRIPLECLSEPDIDKADIIVAVDKTDKTRPQQLYGQESIASMVLPGAPSRVLVQLEIEIDSSDDAQLQDAISRIETTKGHLPQDVQRLRKPR